MKVQPLKSTSPPIRFASGASAIDAGFGMTHASTLVATTDDVFDSVASGVLHLSVNGRSTSARIAELGLGPGVYDAEVGVEVDGGKAVTTPTRLILIEPRHVQREFGARYASLDYDQPVVIGPGVEGGEDRYVTWSSLWENGPHEDVVVDFEEDYKLMFWRGTGYVPAWAVNNVLTTNFFAETVEPGVFRDCCEPMSDRECRYSRARILHSSPARAVIHWRYALCDADYTICRDYWVDELFYIYPDGVAVRNCTLHLDAGDPDIWITCPETGGKIPVPMMAGVQGKRSFSNTEFITVNPPGNASEDVTPPKAFTILDLEEFEQTYSWPHPPDFKEQPMPRLEHYLYRMNYRDRPGVFLTTNSDGLKLLFQDNVGMQYLAFEDLSRDTWDRSSPVPGRFADFIHWPITRGHWTRSISDPAMYHDRPTHTFLGYSTANAVRVTDEGAVTWRWLCGMAPHDDLELRARARGWHCPPDVEGATYDADQAAYVVLDADRRRLTLPEGAVWCRPAFVLPGAGGDPVRVTANGKEVPCAAGIEESGAELRTVVTVKGALPAGAQLELEIL